MKSINYSSRKYGLTLLIIVALFSFVFALPIKVVLADDEVAVAPTDATTAPSAEVVSTPESIIEPVAEVSVETVLPVEPILPVEPVLPTEPPVELSQENPVISFASAIESVEATSSQSVATTTVSIPVVSIGVGNGNSPENTGPIHGSVYNGLIPVYATLTDANNDLSNYHFRVIKDGGAQGHTCADLFATENQGYASTTLGKTTCGFNFNQSVYMGASGFTNTTIATLDARDLVAFGGEGDYWLVLGVVDFAQNRVAPNYLEDPKVKITLDLTAPVTSAQTATTSNSISITGTSTDAYGVGAVTLSQATSTNGVCGDFSPITTITASSANNFNWNYNWTPSQNGNYCVKAFATDTAGNIETSIVAGTDLAYLQPALVIDPPVVPPTTGGGARQTGGGSGYVYSQIPTGQVAVTPTVTVTPTEDESLTNRIVAAVSGLTNVAEAAVSEPTTTDTVIASSTTSNQSLLASVGILGFAQSNWLWILILLIIIALIIYYSARPKNK